MTKKTQAEGEHQENNQSTKVASNKQKKQSKAFIGQNVPSTHQGSFPSNHKHQPIPSKNAPIIRDNPIATILQALSRFFDHQISLQSLHIYLLRFHEAFELYMRNSKAMSGAQLMLKEQLYALETSIGKSGSDPRQSHELELLKEYLEQLGQKEKTMAHQASQLKAYIESYQNRFRNPKDEQKLRGFRQIYVGKQSSKVLRIGYDSNAQVHQMYLVNENQDQVIDQHLYPE